MLDHYVNKNESNKIDQDSKQDKETKYRRDDQNTTNIFDKEELDQDHMRVKSVSLTIRTIHTMTKDRSCNMRRNPSQKNQIS